MRAPFVTPLEKYGLPRLDTWSEPARPMLTSPVPPLRSMRSSWDSTSVALAVAFAVLLTETPATRGGTSMACAASGCEQPQRERPGERAGAFDRASEVG